MVEPERRVTFRIADGASADGDAALLRVILDNLLGNAWKYTATREEGIIEFGTTEVDGKLVWFVRDNGTGFDMADADKLFAPFQRLPGADEFRDFGIGLATVERIIRRHGGRVWAEGEPGKGHAFTSPSPLIGCQTKFYICEEGMAAKFYLEKSSLLQAGPRLMQILRVLNRHKFLSALRGKDHRPTPKEVREAFEELGLTFLKLGQVLAMRRDLLPDAYIHELEQLHDHLPAMDFDVVRATVEAELGVPLAELFSSFSETPLAAATIGQVHEATMQNGRHVAVKVQRPGLEAMIATDIAALTYLVTLGENLFSRLRALDLPVLVQEFAASLKRETDFSREADAIRLSRTALANVPDFWIPDVVAECSGKTVLTLDFCDGERVDLYARQHPEAVPQAINTLVRVMLQTIFEEGLFHADPHPGNVLILPDGRLCLLDFGMTGELDEPMREALTLLLGAVVKGDARRATDAYLDMVMASEKVNRAALMLDIKAVLYEIHRSNLADVSVGDAFALLLRAGSRHRVHNPGEFFHLTRAFVIIEALIRQLDPSFDYIRAFREQISRLTAQHFSVERIKEKTGKFALDLEQLLIDAPGNAHRIMRRIAEGNLGRVQAPAMEDLGGRATRYLGRLPGAIISAALMVSGGLLVNAPRDAGWHHEVGQIMVTVGIFSTVILSVKIMRRNRGRR